MIIQIKKHISIIFAVLILSFGIMVIYVSLDKNHLPKPYGFAKIELPNHEYVELHKKYPYSFHVSKHATIIDETKSEYGPHCITIKYPDFDAEIQITYKNFKGNKDDLRKLVKSSKSLAYRHQVKAYEIKENLLELDNGMLAVVIELSGEVPTHMQFYTTDLQNHFIRGALYFQTSTQNDYLEPIINFMKEDMFYLLKTFQWENIQNSDYSKKQSTIDLNK